MKVNKITVLGAGIMGSGIAQVAAQAGYQVTLRDLEDKLLAQGLASIQKSLELMKSKGKMTPAQATGVLERITCTSEMKKAALDADLVIEAVPENLELKKQIFRELAKICPKHTILASNTSSLSISTLGAVTDRPDKVIGMHFAAPAQVMVGLEVILGADTSAETLATVKEVARRMGKDPHFSKDYPGFIGSRLISIFINEAFWELFEGIATAEHIDQHCKQQFRHAMGALELADFIGLDTVLSILEHLHREMGDRFRPCPLLRQLVAAGRLGRKTGRGVYEYRAGSL